MRNVLAVLLPLLFIVPLCGVLVWVLFWIANGVMWLSGIGGEALLSELFLRDAGTFSRIIIYLLGFEWIYGAAYFMALHETCKLEDSDADFFDIIITVVMTGLIIIVYDPRIGPHLSGWLGSFVHWLQDSCNARLLGGFSMMEVDFSGKITDPVYYSLFDAIIIVTGAFWLICQFFLSDRSR